MPQCEVVVAVGKRPKPVVVEIAANADLGQFETVGDLCAALALELEPNADKVLSIGGLVATKAEIAKATKGRKATEPAEDAGGEDTGA